MYTNPDEYFSSQVRRAIAFLGIPLVPVLIYTVYVGVTGTGYEPSLRQHFEIVHRGVALDLASCYPRFPITEEVVGAPANQPREQIPSGSFVSAAFRAGDTEFYLLVKRPDERDWLVLHNPKLDYRDYRTRAWVAELRGGLDRLHCWVLVEISIRRV